MKQVHYKGDRERLDVIISSLLDITRSQAQKKIKSGEVKVNGKMSNPSKMIAHASIITVTEKKPIKDHKSIPKIDIIYEDENIIVVNKQAGMVVHHDSKHKSGTLLDALKSKISIQGEERPGVVHRLDKDTSGLLIFARNEKTAKELKKIIKERRVRKTYLALVWGKVKPKKGRIDIPIQRADKDRKKMAAGKTGREALTEYEVIKYYHDMTLLKIRIITGRTHQIRVHFSGLGYPIVGDKVYGRKSDGLELNRQFLHAHELEFELYGKKYHPKSNLPKDLDGFIKTLK